mmetsp:Transcript_11633/g.41875  ORF Transcript_11633/g.41875 Transcript_11633/m.41875 type:complete len:205 (+) Transcript_11633:293-907(+)
MHARGVQGQGGRGRRRRRVQASDAVPMGGDGQGGEGRGAEGGAEGGGGGGRRARAPRRGPREGRGVRRPAEGARRSDQEAQAREAGRVEDVRHLQGRGVRVGAEKGARGSDARDDHERVLEGRGLQGVQPRPRRGRAAERRTRPPAAEGQAAVPRDVSAARVRGDADEQLRRVRVLEFRHADPAADAPGARRARHVLHETPRRR